MWTKKRKKKKKKKTYRPVYRVAAQLKIVTFYTLENLLLEEDVKTKAYVLAEHKLFCVLLLVIVNNYGSAEPEARNVY